jgi:hypothetical protein
VCPFDEHIDTDPSFTVYPDGSYHCFGCRAHGTLSEILDYFGADGRYDLSRIDVSSISSDNHEYLRRCRIKAESKLRSLLKKTKVGTKKKVYDYFDRQWLQIKNDFHDSKLDISRSVNKILFKIESSIRKGRDGQQKR